MSGENNNDLDDILYDLQKQQVGKVVPVAAQWGGAKTLNPPMIQTAVPVAGDAAYQFGASKPAGGYQAPGQFGGYQAPVYQPAPVAPPSYYQPVATNTYVAKPQGGGSLATMRYSELGDLELGRFKRPGWHEVDEKVKQMEAEKERTIYCNELVQATGRNMDDEITQSVVQKDQIVTEYHNITTRSEQILAIRHGFAIPSYATSIETVEVAFSEALRYGQASTLISKTVTERKEMFGSADTYGQGKAEVLLTANGRPRLMGNLKNTFICKITLTNIRSTMHGPIGVTFGETEGQAFVPYYDHMKHVDSRSSQRYHYIIPPLADQSGPVTVYVNSKDANHPFGYYYSWLTDDPKSIVEKGQVGTYQGANGGYKYAPDHPIVRYLKWYGAEEGLINPPVVTEPDPDTGQSRMIVSIPSALATHVAVRISKLCRNTIPTRDLEKFNIKLESLADPHFTNRQQKDYPLKQLEVMKQGSADAKKMDPVADAFPVYFQMSMAYLFRDDAADIYNHEVKMMTSSY